VCRTDRLLTVTLIHVCFIIRMNTLFSIMHSSICHMFRPSSGRNTTNGRVYWGGGLSCTGKTLKCRADIACTDACSYSTNHFPASRRFLLCADACHRYGLGGPGIESRWEVEIIRIRPDRPLDPPSLLYRGYRVCFPGIKRHGRGVDIPLLSSAEIKEIVDLLPLWAFVACSGANFYVLPGTI
jgi:hypothetical protein